MFKFYVSIGNLQCFRCIEKWFIYIYIFLFRFFPIVGYYKILNMVPYAVCSHSFKIPSLFPSSPSSISLFLFLARSLEKVFCTCCFYFLCCDHRPFGCCTHLSLDVIWPVCIIWWTWLPPPFHDSLKFYLFILLLTMSGLRCRLFSGCGERGLLSSCGVQASHGSGWPWCGARAPGCKLE